mgnify:CR=1 FL=1
MEKDTKQLFQITEAARACGLSRSTLMRIEEKGLLTPAYTAPDSGRRYYDNHNVARILQIEKFKAMGLDTEDIAAYFAHGGEASGMLTVLERRLLDLQRSVEELRLRALEPPCTSVQMMTLPAVTCCMRWSVGLTTADRYADMYSFYGECVRRGYRQLRHHRPAAGAAVHHLPAAGLSGGVHRRYALPLRGLRSGAAQKGAGGRCDAAGMPGAVGAVLR